MEHNELLNNNQHIAAALNSEIEKKIFVLKKHRFGEKTDYQRFIILFTGRSGSNWLTSLLDSHSEIAIYAELFPFDKSSNVYCPGYWQVKYPYIRNQIIYDPISILNALTFRGYGENVKAVGFKFSYQHHEKILDYLDTHRDTIKVIHLSRRNLLRSLISVKIANLRQEWLKPIDQKKRIKVKLSLNECIDYFSKIEKEKAKCEVKLSGNQTLNIYYEDLLKDPETQLNRIQTFLQVTPNLLKSDFKKSNIFSTKQVLENYDELLDYFKDTPYAHFFNEVDI